MIIMFKKWLSPLWNERINKRAEMVLSLSQLLISQNCKVVRGNSQVLKPRRRAPCENTSIEINYKCLGVFLCT